MGVKCNVITVEGIKQGKIMKKSTFKLHKASCGKILILSTYYTRPTVVSKLKTFYVHVASSDRTCAGRHAQLTGDALKAR